MLHGDRVRVLKISDIQRHEGGTRSIFDNLKMRLRMAREMASLRERLDETARKL